MYEKKKLSVRVKCDNINNKNREKSEICRKEKEENAFQLHFNQFILFLRMTATKNPFKENNHKHFVALFITALPFYGSLFIYV